MVPWRIEDRSTFVVMVDQSFNPLLVASAWIWAQIQALATSLFFANAGTPAQIRALAPFFQLRRPGELVNRRSTTPVLVPGLTLVLERRVRHVARPLLNSDRCGPSAPPWAPIYRRPHSLVASEAFAVQTRRMGLNLVDPPLFAPATLPESLFHDRPWLLSPLIIPPLFTGSQSNTNSAPQFRRYATKNETQPSIVAATLGGRVGGSK